MRPGDITVVIVVVKEKFKATKPSAVRSGRKNSYELLLSRIFAFKNNFNRP